MRADVVIPPSLASRLAPTIQSPPALRLQTTSPVIPFKQRLESSLKAHSTEETPHTVEKGDTLSHIVRDELKELGLKVTGSAIQKGVEAVARQNQLSDPNRIYPGQALDLGVLNPRQVPPAPGAITLKESPAPETATEPEPTPVKWVSLPPPPLELTVSTERTPRLPSEGGPVLQLPQRNALRGLVGRVAQEAVEKSVDLGELIQRVLHPGQNAGEKAATPGTRDNPWKSTLDGPARLTSEFGRRKDPFTGNPAFHNGIDLAAKTGTKIYPYKPGVVTFSGWKSGYGNAVIVKHDDGLESVYGHASKNLVQPGDRVESGTVLAEVGSTGRSTGPHLHFEIRKSGKAVDPVPYLTQHNH